MAGWTALLVWGAAQPVQRRGVLLLTTFPVVVGLAGAGGYAIASGLVRPVFIAPIFTVQAIACAIFVTAHRSARRAAAEHA